MIDQDNMHTWYNLDYVFITLAHIRYLYRMIFFKINFNFLNQKQKTKQTKNL